MQCSLAARHSAATGLATSTAADALHGSLLRDRGFVVLPDPIMSDELLSDAAALSRNTLAQRLSEVKAIGCDPVEQQYVFREICHRQRNRWDMRLPTSDPAWSQLCDAAVAAATPVIRQAQGAAAFSGVLPLMSGVVVSRPGARVQVLSLHPRAQPTTRLAPRALHHSPCTTRLALPTVHRSPCTTRLALPTVHRSPCTTHRAPFTFHHSPCTYCVLKLYLL